MTPSQIRLYCKREPDAEALLRNAMEEMGLSARARDKILRISLTIAELEATDHIKAAHLRKAIDDRTPDWSF